MDPLILAVAVIISYLFGSISFARIITRLIDPDAVIGQTEMHIAEGEGLAKMDFYSATTVSMRLGSKYGLLVTALDMLKVAAPVWVLRWLYPDQPYFLIAAVAGMVGHIWPVYYGFSGARGMSAVYGSMLAIDWIGMLATGVGGLLLGMFVLRDVVTIYMGGLWLIIPWMWFRTHDLAHVLYAVAVNLLFILAMLPEIREIIRIRREGKALDFAAAMELTPMGKGLYKMAKRFGVIKEPSG